MQADTCARFTHTVSRPAGGFESRQTVRAPAAFASRSGATVICGADGPCNQYCGQSGDAITGPQSVLFRSDLRDRPGLKRALKRGPINLGIGGGIFIVQHAKRLEFRLHAVR